MSVFAFEFAQNCDSPSGSKYELEHFPLIIGDVTLFRGRSTAFPNDSYTPSTRKFLEDEICTRYASALSCVLAFIAFWQMNSKLRLHTCNPKVTFDAVDNPLRGQEHDERTNGIG